MGWRSAGGIGDGVRCEKLPGTPSALTTATACPPPHRVAWGHRPGGVPGAGPRARVLQDGEKECRSRPASRAGEGMRRCAPPSGGPAPPLGRHAPTSRLGRARVGQERTGASPSGPPPPPPAMESKPRLRPSAEESTVSATNAAAPLGPPRGAADPCEKVADSPAPLPAATAPHGPRIARGPASFRGRYLQTAG